MANYKQVSYGSQGSDVTELQKLLNQNGYSLVEDGNFGPNTQAAVKDYQKKSGLADDGIVGENTWGALTKAQTGAAASTTTTPADTSSQYGAYQESDIVKQAEAMLQQQMANKPGAYQSLWQTQLNDIINKINNREQFSYDLNGDALYHQYKDLAVTQGKLASMDVMGQAAAMTGGYGNSYAQTVGQQAYQGYLQGLNDKIPELYNLAMSKYQMEGDDMRNQLAILAQQEGQDYGRYRDQVSDYYTDLDRLYNQYNTERDYDYGKWADGRDFAYQTDRDKAADEKWQAEFDEAKRQYDQQYALSTKKSYTPTGDDDDDDDGGEGYDNGSLDENQIKYMQYSLGVTADGKWGPASKKAAGGLDADAAYKLWNQGKLGKSVLKEQTEGGGGGLSFTGTTYQEAAAFLKTNGYSTSGLMTNSEWTRHKNNKSSAGGEHEASSYAEYLAAYVYGATKK